MGTFYHGDCLLVMQHDIAPESVDLIYLDPPFFTGKIQKGTRKWQPGAMEISFQDSKKFWAEKGLGSKDVPEWIKHIAREGKKSSAFASYLYYMMERLQACHRVLKSTGSIYLHCDWRASHYLKMVMDEVFGSDNFRNEIVWGYNSTSRGSRDFGRKHDLIFRYSKSRLFYFQSMREPYADTVFSGRFGKDDKGYYNVVRGKKYYIHPEGRMIGDVWNIGIIGQRSHERTGYPTQKPEMLLERIITTSSREGDVVLDPFCGCGTTVIVASKLNRQWIGIDIDQSPHEKGALPTAFQVIRNRSHSLFEQATYIPRDLSEVLEMDARQFEAWVNVFYRARKPMPDRGVDGITADGIPIQVKTNEIKYSVLSQFITDAKLHLDVRKPLSKAIVVSQTGFDDSARQRQFGIKSTEGIEIEMITPKEMLGG